MRVYLSSTLPRLAEARATGVVARSGGTAQAVTAAVERAHPGVDEEEREHVAFVSAAELAQSLLDADGDPGGLRVVLSVDIASGVEPGGHHGAAPDSTITLTSDVPLSALVSIHVEDPDDQELLWYDISELDDILAQEDS